MAEKKKYTFEFKLTDPVAAMLLGAAKRRGMTPNELIIAIITGTVTRGSVDKQIMLAHDYRMGEPAGSTGLRIDVV